MDNGYKPVEFQDALYVPDLRTNLISVAKITDKNNEISFKKNEAIVSGMDGRLIAKAKRIGNLYYIYYTTYRITYITYIILHIGKSRVR